MKTISVKTGRPYDIHIGSNILSRCGKRIAAISQQEYLRVAIVTDDIAGGLYGAVVADSIKEAGFEVHTYTFPNGESHKNIETAMDIVSFLSDRCFTRGDLVVALGGGVVGDLAGFAASVYQRGVDYVQVPTTFLAAIDSSVGGKTAVNIPQAKNLVGTFWQPRLVICDVATLSTLEEDTFGDGVAEAIKYGCIWDAELFERIAQGDLKENLVDIVARCVAIKAQVVAADERDYGLRQLLNFGHTAGHAVEKLSGYTISHGKGVAIGMVIAAQSGEQAGVTPPGTAVRIRQALECNGLPRDCAYDASQLAQVCLRDKKRSGNEIGFILLESIGKAVIHRLPADTLETFLQV